MVLVPPPVVGFLPAGEALGSSGYLVIEDVRDPNAGFHWASVGTDGFRTLTWSEGELILPDSLQSEDFSLHDLGVVCATNLAGTGASGQVVLTDGIFTVSEPVVLSDGILELRVTGGELEIRGAMVRYRRPAEDSNGYGPGLLMLAGMTLLVIVLLRRARLKSGERSGL